MIFTVLYMGRCIVKKICILAAYYPSLNDPIFSFLGALVEQMSIHDVECHVIAPQSLFEKKHVDRSRVVVTKTGARIYVYCPKYIVIPARNVLKFNTYRLVFLSQKYAVRKTFYRYVKSADAIYSHFLMSGIYGAALSKMTGIPSYLAIGESVLKKSWVAYKLYGKLLQEYTKGIITVSSALSEEIKEMKIFSHEAPILTLPNGIDLEQFTVTNKFYRKNIGLKDDDFVVIFVGHFIKRKGIDKLQNILNKHPEWKAILIGEGEIPIWINADQIAYVGTVEHMELPKYLNAADVFVLPTLAEGCCNSIIEAMGCGLPVISSNKKFNDDILDDSCSIRIDPDNENDIENAIYQLYINTDLRERLARGAEKKARCYSLEKRTKKILDFIGINTSYEHE